MVIRRAVSKGWVLGMKVDCSTTWQNVHKWVESIVSRTLNYEEEKVVTGYIDPMDTYSESQVCSHDFRRISSERHYLALSL